MYGYVLVQLDIVVQLDHVLHDVLQGSLGGVLQNHDVLGVTRLKFITSEKIDSNEEIQWIWQRHQNWKRNDITTFRLYFNILTLMSTLQISFFKQILVKIFRKTLFLRGLELSFQAKTEFFKIFGIWVFENPELSFSVLYKKSLNRQRLSWSFIGYS